VVPVAQVRDRHPVDQVLFGDGHFLLRGEVPTLPYIRTVVIRCSRNPPSLRVMLTPAKENSSSL
jgi:hypothetical protein